MAIKVSRPHMPAGYIPNPKSTLTWAQVAHRMDQAQNYWIASVGPDQQPHVTPVWGVWLDDRFYFDGDPATRHLRNLRKNPQVAVHLESGSQVLVLYGRCQQANTQALPTAEIARIYRRKYAGMGYEPDADQWDAGGLYLVIPEKVIAWTEFSTDPTKFTLTAED